ncbi:MAG: response regulator [Cyanobacteria bacterium]|nr:response regulator [Cyanobacteriota bacterium]
MTEFTRDVVPETFFDEMKRYVGFTADDAARLASLAPVVEPHLPAMADRFYEQIPRHTEAAAVFTGGEAQIARLKLTLQHWARGLFSGVYGEAYAQERFRIGYRHVQIALPQRYVISAMHIVGRFLGELLDREIRDPDQRHRARGSLERIIILDLGLICETYFEGSVRELKQLNDRLNSANRALQEANRVKADFLATTSHELRTPLTSIIGFSRLLVDGYVTDAAEQRDLLADVHRSALHLLSLVDDILDLSRIEAGRFEITVESVDIAALIAESAALTKVQADAKSLALRADAPGDLPLVRGDGSRLRQILLNVIGNAIKFTDRGEVQVTAATDSDATHVVIGVADTGIGIAPEQQPLLFEKFRQLDASHTRRHGGSGLGLAISKALIERMGGRIHVRSEGRGFGTTVTLTVPVATQALLDGAASTPIGVGPWRSSVLLAAEDAAAREAMAISLKSGGHAVREGATVDGVRALIYVERPDVLLIDLTTAGAQDTHREWLDLLVALHANLQTRSIRPVVLIDRAAPAPTRVQLALLPIRPTILDKPLDGTDLKRMLERVSSSPRATPLRVLVADDDPMVFKFVTSILPPHEYILQHAASGAEVLRAVDAQQFDAILLDLRMPDQSGYDVIRALKLEGRAPDLPILVITNYPEPADAQEQMLLASPLALEVLTKAVVAARPEVLIQQLEAIRRES